MKILIPSTLMFVLGCLPMALPVNVLAQFGPPPTIQTFPQGQPVQTAPTYPSAPTYPAGEAQSGAATFPGSADTTAGSGVGLSATPVAGQEGTVITAEKLTFDYKKSYALFEQNVEVDDPGIFLTCDTMEVRFDQNDEIETIVAKGQVRIRQEDFSATAQLATYDVRSGDIQLEVNPVVVKGQDILRGGMITYNRFDEKLVTTGGVKMFLLKKEGKGGLPMPGPAMGRGRR